MCERCGRNAKSIKRSEISANRTINVKSLVSNVARNFFCCVFSFLGSLKCLMKVASSRLSLPLNSIVQSVSQNSDDCPGESEEVFRVVFKLDTSVKLLISFQNWNEWLMSREL